MEFLWVPIDKLKFTTFLGDAPKIVGAFSKKEKEESDKHLQ